MPQWTHQQIHGPVQPLPNLLKRKVNHLQLQVNTPILRNVVSPHPTTSVQFLSWVVWKTSAPGEIFQSLFTVVQLLGPCRGNGRDTNGKNRRWERHYQLWENIDEYGDRYQYDSAYILETIEPQTLILLATHRTPSDISQAFEDKSSRENTCSFFDQLNSVFDTKYNTLELFSDPINKYDTLWNRLHLRSSTATSSDRYALLFAFQSVFESRETKAAIVFGSLHESMNNMVDNL